MFIVGFSWPGSKRNINYCTPVRLVLAFFTVTFTTLTNAASKPTLVHTTAWSDITGYRHCDMAVLSVLSVPSGFIYV